MTPTTMHTGTTTQSDGNSEDAAKLGPGHYLETTSCPRAPARLEPQQGAGIPPKPWPLLLWSAIAARTLWPLRDGCPLCPSSRLWSCALPALESASADPT